MELTQSDIDYFNKIRSFNIKTSEASTQYKRWNLIREAYKVVMPAIMSRHAVGGRICPYFLDWHFLFSPLEELVWTDIRAVGIPFYPQVPVLNFFIDFADPYKRIGIEADGKAFHNPEKDKIRDEKLAAIGWRIYRIPYAFTYKIKDDFIGVEEPEEDNKEQLLKYKTKSSEGIISSIFEQYYRNKQYVEEEGEGLFNG